EWSKVFPARDGTEKSEAVADLCADRWRKGTPQLPGNLRRSGVACAASLEAYRWLVSPSLGLQQVHALTASTHLPTILANSLASNACMVSVRTLQSEASSVRQCSAFVSLSAFMMRTPS